MLCRTHTKGDPLENVPFAMKIIMYIVRRKTSSTNEWAFSSFVKSESKKEQAVVGGGLSFVTS